MRRVYSLYGTSVGKKYTMAVSGAIFVLFVIVHMFGNLKVYLGPEPFNHYAEDCASLAHRSWAASGSCGSSGWASSPFC